ncbi:MAG: LLM class flavin-dependent oxidoreductase [Deltaproteobacteria bacterium]|nr:LLM class flavin-dependent oxidoreductase [Deltaproteobacteria bacterium]
MEIGKIGVFVFLDAMRAPETAEFARKVERLGYGALWFPEAWGREPFAHASVFLDQPHSHEGTSGSQDGPCRRRATTLPSKPIPLLRT